MSRVSSSPTSKAGGSMATQPVAPATQQPMMASDGMMVPHEKIAMRAYEIWCQRGCPVGSDRDDWYEAEKELKAELSRGAKKSRKA